MPTIEDNDQAVSEVPRTLLEAVEALPDTGDIDYEPPRIDDFLRPADLA
ncbi:MAG TPA: hypothetical protein VFR90_06795 [Methylibium sp.]|nr:hypothetical protein [Methylibium sp.]HEU4458813.1 hypothetical protein [Methylibium sp.]